MAKSQSTSGGFTAVEQEAMKARAKELAAEQRAAKKREVGEQECLQVITSLDPEDRALAEGIHALVSRVAPELWPKTWYGMPAYARDGQVICFFQPAKKFSSRYSTFGFNDAARLDSGALWPTAFAVKQLGPEEESLLGTLIRRAVDGV